MGFRGVSDCRIEKIPLEAIFKGMIPFLVAIVLAIILTTAFLQIILILPQLMF